MLICISMTMAPNDLAKQSRRGEPRPRQMMGFGLEIEIVKLRVKSER